MGVAEKTYERLQTLPENLQQEALHYVEFLQSKIKTVALPTQSTIQSNKKSMAGCLAQYAKPELIENETQLLDDALTDTLKEKYCVD